MLFNPTLIDRVNKFMTNNIRSKYICHTFLELSRQFHQTIYRVNIWGYFDSVPKHRVNLVYFDLILNATYLMNLPPGRFPKSSSQSSMTLSMIKTVPKNIGAWCIFFWYFLSLHKHLVFETILTNNILTISSEIR